jgi:anti-sigma regulatory factor (Ser/Thr protein kinase)
MALYRQLRDLNIGALLFGNAQANQDAKKRLKRLGCEVYPVRNQKDYQKIMTKVSRFFRSQNAHLAGSLEGKDDHNLVGMAALELAANILVHANSPGFILVRRVETPAGSAIELIAWDQGEKGMNEDAFNRRLGDSGRDQGGDLLKPSGRGLNIAASYAINQGRGWILVETAREGHGKSVLFGQPGLIERGESPITVGTRVTARFFLAASTPGSAREAPGSSWLRRGSVMILFTFLWLSAALAARSAVWWRGPVNPAADMGSPVGFSTPAEPAAFGPNPPGRAGELPALSHKSGQRRSTTAHRWHDEFGLPADSFWMHDPSPLFKQGQLEFIITPSYTYQSLQGFLIRFSILYSSERGLEPTRYSIVCHKQASGGWTKKLYPTRPDADSWPKGIMVEEPPGANSVTVIIPESDILGLEKIYQAQHGSSLLIEFDARKEIATKEIPHEILNPEGDVPVNLYIQSPGKDSPNETPAPAKPDTNAEPRSSDLMPSFGFGWPGILSMGLLLGMMARISGEKPSKKQPAAASSGVAERAVLHLEKTGGRAAPRAGPTVSNPKPNSMRRDPAVRGATQKLPEKLRGSRGMRLDQEPDLASFLEAITRRAQERQKPKSFALHPAAPPAAPLNQSRHRDNAIKRLEEQILPVLSAALGVAEHAIHNFLWSYEPNLRSVVIRGLFDAIQEGRLTTPQDMKDYADSRPSNESLLKAVLKGLLQLSAIAGSVDRPQAQLLRQRFQPGHSMEKLRSSKVPLTGRRKLRRKAMLDPQSHRTRDDKSSSNRKREIFQDRIRDLTKDEEGAAEEATSPTDTAAPRTAGPGPSNVADSAAAPKGLAPMVMESIRSRTIRYYTSDQRGAHIRWFYYHFPNVAIGWYSAFHEWLVSYWLRTWVSGHTNAGWKHWAEGIGIHFASAIPLILAIFNLWHNPNLTHWSYVVASAPFGFALNPIIHGILDTLAAINKWLMQRLEKAWPQAGTVARAMTLAYAVMDKEPDGDSAPDGTRGFRFDRRSFLAALGVGIAGSIGVVVFHKWFGALGSQRPPWQSYEQFESLRFWADIMQLDRDPEFVDDATYNHDQAVTKQGDHEWRDALRKFYRDYHPVLKEILEIESSPVVELARSFGVFPAAATMPEVLSQESQDILNRWLRARSRQQALLVELNDRLLLPRGWCVFGEGNTSGFALARVVGREDFVQTTELRHGGRRSRPVTLIKGEVFDAHTGTFVNRSDSAGSEWGFLFMGVPNRGLIFEDAATFVGRTLKIRKLVESPETPADPDEQLTGVYYRAALIRDGFFKNGRLADDWEKTYEKVAIDHEFTHSALMWDSAADPRTTLQEAFAHAGELMSALQTMFLSQLSIQGVRDVEIRQGLAKGSIHAGMMRASYSMLIVASLAAQLNLHRDAIGILEAKSNKVGEVIAAVARRNHDAISALARGIQQDIGSTLDAPLRWWVDKQITDPRLLPPSPPCHSAKLGANPKASPKSEAIALAAALGIGLAVVPSSVLQQHLTAVVLALMTAVASAVYAATDAIPLLGTVATSAVNVFKAVARPTTAATRRIHSLLAAA